MPSVLALVGSVVSSLTTEIEVSAVFVLIFLAVSGHLTKTEDIKKPTATAIGINIKGVNFLFLDITSPHILIN